MAVVSWKCHQCTFLNHPDLNSCELCNWTPLQLEIPTTADSSSNTISVLNDDNHCIAAYVECSRCSYHNVVGAQRCLVCDNADSFTPSQQTAPNLTGSLVKSKCPRCHVNLTGTDSIKSSSSSSSARSCPACQFDLSYGTHQGSSKKFPNKKNRYPGQSGHLDDAGNDQESGAESITYGVIELIAKALSRDEQDDGCNGYKNVKNTKKITVEYALCSPCPHVSQRGYDGSNWSCGYRNIQMICYSLLGQSDSKNDYKSALFNGKGSLLFCSALFCSALFCSLLFYSALFYSSTFQFYSSILFTNHIP